jgi:hypothetical protein
MHHVPIGEYVIQCSPAAAEKEVMTKKYDAEK